MAEEEVSYASLVIKSKEHPQSEVKNENEAVYNEVKVDKEPAQAKSVEDATYAEVQRQNERVQQTSDKTGLLSDKAAERCRRYQLLASCFGTLCVILVLSIIGVCVYLGTVHESAARELNQVKSQQKVLLEENHNLTNLNNKLSSDYQNLTVQFNNLNAENHNLTSLNEGLRKERENLTEVIKNMEKPWNELNVSRAQWSIDAYCPKKPGVSVRNCTSCQKDWSHQSPSCYAYNNAAPSDRRNWESAREDCWTKNSDLTVVSDQTEKDYVKTISLAAGDQGSTIQGYWIGLRAVEGKWKWIDGSDLTNQTWIQKQPATDGQCVTSLQNREWKSVRCNETNAWICEKKALSV